VVIASQDFSVFSHVHPEDFGALSPEMKKTARYPVRFSFPKAGRYIIGIDFAVREQLFSKQFLVAVTGEPKMGPPGKDFSREKRFGGLEVTFASAPERIVAGKEVTLSYLFRKNGKPVDDLEPYLSAPMHLAIISSDLSRFMHTHGEVPGMTGAGHHEHHGEMHMAVPDRFGPNIEVHVEFPVKGLYEIFGQLRHRGKVIDTSFMVEVE
jgi:Cu+-exporting ATPase